MSRTTCLLLISALYLLFTACGRRTMPDYSKWERVHGNEEGNHYSSLVNIDTDNVTRLRPVWEFHTGDADTMAHSQIQCNPIIVNGVMYCTSPQLKLFAIDAATGTKKWVFTPFD